MGLFTSKKNLCPVCGEGTPKLLPTKIEGTPICKACANKVELPEGALNQMSINAFAGYIAFYDNNQSKRDVFQETFTYSQGFFKSDIAVDAANRLFRLRNVKEALVFEAAHLKSFRIFEDGKVIYENGGNALICNETDTVDRIKGMTSAVEQFRARRQQHEMMKRMQKREEEAARQRGEDYHSPYIPTPFFEGNEPFNNFYIEFKRRKLWRLECNPSSSMQTSNCWTS